MATTKPPTGAPACTSRLVDLRSSAEIALPCFLFMTWIESPPPAQTSTKDAEAMDVDVVVLDGDDDDDSELKVPRLELVVTDGSAWYACELSRAEVLKHRPEFSTIDEFLGDVQSHLHLHPTTPGPAAAVQFRVEKAGTGVRVTASTSGKSSTVLIDAQLPTTTDTAPHLIAVLAHAASLPQRPVAPTATTAPLPATQRTTTSTAATPRASKPSASSTPRATPASRKSATSTAVDKELQRQKKEEEKLAKERAKEEERLAKELAREEERMRKEQEKQQKIREREEAKERARVEKERAKAEKDKKAGNTAMMDMFVKRAKPAQPAHAATAASGVAGAPATGQRDFDRIFTDFQPRRGVSVAPINFFVPDEHKVAMENLRTPLFHPAPITVRLQNPDQFDDPHTLPPHTFKLLKFHEDRRPAFWGTWSKTSSVISARRPLARDPAVLDYEYDSEAEWDDEDVDGEEIRSDEDDEDDEEMGVDDDDEAAWLVDDVGDASDTVEVATNSAADVRKRVPRKLEPVVIEATVTTGPWECPHPALDPFRAIFLTAGMTSFDPRPPPATLVGGPSAPTTTAGPHSAGRKPAAFPEEHMVKFVKVVHQNTNGVSKIVDELRATPEFASTPKTQLEARLKQIAVKEKRHQSTRPCFYVRDEVLAEHGLAGPRASPIPPAASALTGSSVGSLPAPAPSDAMDVDGTDENAEDVDADDDGESIGLDSEDDDDDEDEEEDEDEEDEDDGFFDVDDGSPARASASSAAVATAAPGSPSKPVPSTPSKAAPTAPAVNQTTQSKYGPSTLAVARATPAKAAPSAPTSVTPTAKPSNIDVGVISDNEDDAVDADFAAPPLSSPRSPLFASPPALPPPAATPVKRNREPDSPTQQSHAKKPRLVPVVEIKVPARKLASSSTSSTPTVQAKLAWPTVTKSAAAAASPSVGKLLKKALDLPHLPEPHDGVTDVVAIVTHIADHAVVSDETSKLLRALGSWQDKCRDSAAIATHKRLVPEVFTRVFASNDVACIKNLFRLVANLFKTDDAEEVTQRIVENEQVMAEIDRVARPGADEAMLNYAATLLAQLAKHRLCEDVARFWTLVQETEARMTVPVKLMDGVDILQATRHYSAQTLDVLLHRFPAWVADVEYELLAKELAQTLEERKDLPAYESCRLEMERCLGKLPALLYAENEEEREDN
ncbi:hypothetical protein AMAG_15082 [Allomyces macrogynus ATCC 38327]|uniref:Chromatin assembly factor 1 subunit A dimerization domain-containing protein n=1 Tax=Allomyces macrogynus (strain ATCC 38327) TaxID=578462 RepID=A0A0L0T6D5_ALLM3|nr:hypothetical protein AMAG_15082 [Allomyces macrogynus ATCC 38327]|eukprot:KNE70104.1 hypothetical protein AMAG_15082 [Allomyces macrogynus ATCC 38327]